METHPVISASTLNDVLINEKLAVWPVRVMDPELEIQAPRRALCNVFPRIQQSSG
jgi:hypothetical protein